MSDTLHFGPLEINGHANRDTIEIGTDEAIDLYLMARMMVAILNVLMQAHERTEITPGARERWARVLASLRAELEAAGLEVKEQGE